MKSLIDTVDRDTSLGRPLSTTLIVVGLFLIAAETRFGLWYLPGPLLIVFLLTRWSGVPTVEGRLRRSRPGYEAYVQRTSGFVPWFPKT